MLYLKARNDLMIEFSSAGNLVNGTGFLHSDRYLNTFVLLVGNEGKLYISQDGVEHVLSKGQYLVLFPRMRHFGYRESEGLLNYYWCHFSIPEQDYAIEKFSDAGADQLVLPEHGECLSPEKISLQFRQLIDLSRQPDTQHIKNLSISLMFSELMYDYSLYQKKKSSGLDTNPNINKVVDYIEHNYANPLSTRMLAQRFGYNSNYLSMLFKKCTGTSLVHYINRTRIDAAKSLLLNSSNTVKSIAMQVGFSDEKYFMKTFKAFEQTTPKRYRNLYSHTHINTQ